MYIFMLDLIEINLFQESFTAIKTTINSRCFILLESDDFVFFLFNVTTRFYFVSHIDKWLRDVFFEKIYKKLYITYNL